MVREVTRRSAIWVMLALFGASSLVLLLGELRHSTAAPLAETAKKRRSLTVIDTVRLTLVRKNGNIIVQRGTATGTLPGRVKARFRTSLTKVTGRLTFRPYGGGSITMTAVGYPSSTGRIASLSGSMAVRRGTGKYRNALGSGTFTGTANRRTWAVTVNARANLTY